MSNGSRQAQRSEATRRKLVDAGRRLFADRGFAAVGTEELVREAGVTRGALYHQFADKADLLEAIVDEIDGELTQAIAAGAMTDATGPVEALRAGAVAFLEAVTAPDVHRIVLVDALPVLGWERWRAIGLRHGLGLIEAALAGGMEAGAIRRAPTRPLAHVLLGALDEAALYVVAAEDQQTARAEMLEVLDGLLEGLRA
ncbi:TetR/AcrR family transcriptional regulator [Patulibacter minatonensis]|uniref:TetR/AcrR family transcriptional regulator n=1 Tax=Patulibacter minatonensis TaxID=298163 RepID=UPI00047D7A75|nr:TetR/AcrR family transcriptional regulator [Patulibacter minatonensis]